MTGIKYAIVAGLEHLCGFLDRLPRYDGRWYRHGQWGCVLRLGHLSASLDGRWGTGCWRDRTLKGDD